MQKTSSQKVRKSKKDEMIELNQEERSALINFVQKNDRMPKEVKKTIVKKLEETKVPLSLVNRFRSRMEGN